MELPSEATLKWLVKAYAKLRARHGAVLSEPVLVEPTGDYFPDPFELEPTSVERFFRRMMSYAPLREGLPVQLDFIQPDESPGGGSCGSGACSPGDAPKRLERPAVTELPDGSYHVGIYVNDLGEATILGATFARSIGSLVLLEAGDPVHPKDFRTTSELAATAAGLGLLLLNGTCVYKKACSGLRAHQATELAPEEQAVLLALFLRLHGHKPQLAKRHMAVTQREAFDEALAWVDSNRALVDNLRDHPELLEDGVFTLETTKGFFGRLFSRKEPAVAAPGATSPAKPIKQRSEEERRRLAETRALVAEALEAEE